MPGAGVADGAGEVEDGHNGWMGTRKAPRAGGARTEVVGTCSLIMRLHVHFGGMNHTVAGTGEVEVEVWTLMVMISPVEMGDLVPIGTVEMGDLVPIKVHVG